jgi:hypothetical protein
VVTSELNPHQIYLYSNELLLKKMVEGMEEGRKSMRERGREGGRKKKGREGG